MAKVKKVAIKDEELNPTVIATLEKKKVHLFSLLILLGIFGTTIYYLPDISKKVDAYLNPTLNLPGTTGQTGNKRPDEELEVTKYAYNNELVIETDKFKLNNFSINDNTLTFTVTNKDRIAIDLNDYNYYLALYTESNMLIQRIKFDDISVGALQNTTATYEINNSNVNYFTFIEITPDEYQSYIAPANQDGQATLVCYKDKEKINYLLQDNKLYSIEDIYTVSNTDPDYATLFASFQSLAATYNTMAGVTSNVKVENNIMTFSTYVNLKATGVENINKIVYPKDTDAKIMRFELNSKGYNCN